MAMPSNHMTSPALPWEREREANKPL